MNTSCILATVSSVLLLSCVTAYGKGKDLLFSVTPSLPGFQLIRTSAPFPDGFLQEDGFLRVVSEDRSQTVAWRPLTFHPGPPEGKRFVRRGMITFLWDFPSELPVRFRLETIGKKPSLPETRLPAVALEDGGLRITWPGKETVTARCLAPEQRSRQTPSTTMVEDHSLYRWERCRLPDDDWPVVLEWRVDALGGVVLVAHLQRRLDGNGYAPDFGWQVDGPGEIERSTGDDPWKPLFWVFPDNADWRIECPAAPWKQQGEITVEGSDGGFQVQYLRCRSEDKVPMQTYSWRRAEMVFLPPGLAGLSPTLRTAHRIEFNEELWDKLYGLRPKIDVPWLSSVLAYHRDAIKASVAVGDDWGNLTGFMDGQPSGPAFGMNRLNHCIGVFSESKRMQDSDLLDVALAWCDNMHDLSLWWGKEATGGTRYNNMRAMGQTPPEDDQQYMWRSNSSVHFCTKGFDAFLWAYEETGDPRMLDALEAQVAYAKEHIHANEGECRNVGVAEDFMRLYRYTGDEVYVGEALRLFRELREKLSEGCLFSQGGQPIVPEVPFMDDDAVGYKHPFAKPYIIGYALSGLPDLALVRPDEFQLAEVIRAVSDFLCESQDPLGGWRYPHPSSSSLILSQAMEHAWHLVQADRFLGPQEHHLDAIERVLRQRFLGWRQTGQILSGLGPWEVATGKCEQRSDIASLYHRPEDRDRRLDYAKGEIGVGSCPPEGLVYFPEVLAYYLAHRPARRLLEKPAVGTALDTVLRRLERRGNPLPVRSRNPDPSLLPSLEVWQRDKEILVGCRFPNLPGFTCDAWTYESEVDFVKAVPMSGGGLVLTHRIREHPHLLLVTHVTSDIGAVTFEARVVREPGREDPLPESVLTPNLCWQLKRAEGFASAPDPYPEFVKRCFLFTERGRTFLHETERRPIPCRDLDDPYNRPPWVQMYVGAWQEIPEVTETSWSDYSPDRYTTTVIGAVSQDGQALAAIANDTATLMCQAWHDCMHNNAQWVPAGAPMEERRWRVRIYAMANEPNALMDRVKRDFPSIRNEDGSVPRPKEEEPRLQTPGVKDFLPVFTQDTKGRHVYPLSWHAGNFVDFPLWRETARDFVMDRLLEPPPPVPFLHEIVDEEDRGEYVARKLALCVTGDSRILAYLLVPKGEGPFPGVLLLHDHGARFDIGKEKVIRPIGESQEKTVSSQEWIQECYGGRYLGDELAQRGYVCLCADALNWSDRGGAGYEGQQALAANLFHLGSSLAGRIAHEDLRAAEFLASLPEVDSQRVAAMGLSMGGFRTWQVAALSDHIAAGVSVCWMATVEGLMVPGNNQTRGQSSFTMTHPGLLHLLDYPDIASLACPKPMLFYSGSQDALFPVASVRVAHARMRTVWESQDAGDRLETRIWDVPHRFDEDMQQAAFAWLDKTMASVIPSP